jgi:hypothetical protein
MARTVFTTQEIRTLDCKSLYTFHVLVLLIKLRFCLCVLNNHEPTSIVPSQLVLKSTCINHTYINSIIIDLRVSSYAVCQ